MIHSCPRRVLVLGSLPPKRERLVSRDYFLYFLYTFGFALEGSDLYLYGAFSVYFSQTLY